MQSEAVKEALEKHNQLAKELVTESHDGAITIKLANPIERKNSRVEAITISRPTLADLKKINLVAASEGQLVELAPLIAARSNVSEQELDGMDSGDYLFVAAVVAQRCFRRSAKQLAGDRG